MTSAVPSPIRAARLAPLWLALLSGVAFGQAPLDLGCTGPFSRNAGEAALIRAFGAGNVQRSQIGIGEGETLAGAVIFPKDRKRRLELVWQDGRKRSRPRTIYVREGSSWSVAAPDGARIGLGTPLGAVETANGRPFGILGFGWDYSGTVSDWRGGRLETTGTGCKLTIRFEDTPDAGPDVRNRILGDQEFSSSDRDIRAVKPVVREISLNWRD